MRNILPKDLFLFKGLEENHKDIIISRFKEHKCFKKGDIIYSKELFSNALGYISKGYAVAVTNNGGKVHMKSFKEGAVFGAAAVFGDNSSYVSTIIAKTDMEITFMPESVLALCFTEYPLFALNYICFLSEKIRFLNSKLSIISCSSAEATVLKYFSSVTDDKGFAKLPDNMTLLAKSLGIGRATLYRCIEALEKDGCIVKENNIIRVIKNEKNS